MLTRWRQCTLYLGSSIDFDFPPTFQPPHPQICLPRLDLLHPILSMSSLLSPSPVAPFFSVSGDLPGWSASQKKDRRAHRWESRMPLEASVPRRAGTLAPPSVVSDIVTGGLQRHALQGLAEGGFDQTKEGGCSDTTICCVRCKWLRRHVLWCAVQGGGGSGVCGRRR